MSAWWRCKRKRRYATREEADAVLSSRKEADPAAWHGTRPYNCDRCKGWHIGHPPSFHRCLAVHIHFAAPRSALR